jgi:hypothetical protein
MAKTKHQVLADKIYLAKRETLDFIDEKQRGKMLLKVVPQEYPKQSFI